MTPLLDAHAHPQFPHYDGDRDALLRRARNAGVVRIVAVGTSAEDSRKAVALAEREPDLVRATVGIHPAERNEVELPSMEGSSTSFHWDFVRDLAYHQLVVAIGECGLDYFRIEGGDDEKSYQRELFLKHIALAREVGKPLMIHSRPSQGTYDAYEEIYETLRAQQPVPRFIMHFFVCDDVALANKFLKLGAYFTFGGVLTVTHQYDETVRTLPLERLMTETDAPFVTPLQERGKRNEPAFVKYTLERLAELKETDIDSCAAQILKNADSIFENSKRGFD